MLLGGEFLSLNNTRSANISWSIMFVIFLIEILKFQPTNPACINLLIDQNTSEIEHSSTELHPWG